MSKYPSGWKRLATLFWSFGKIAPLAFGGGYAMIPALDREFVQKRGWFSDKEMADLLSLAGSAPGGIGVNAAVLIGHRIGGISGATAAMIGLSLPSVVIVLALYGILGQFRQYPLVTAALEGIRCAVVAMIAFAAYRLARVSVRDWGARLVMLGTIIVLLLLPLHPIAVLVLGVIFGTAAAWRKQKREASSAPSPADGRERPDSTAV